MAYDCVHRWRSSKGLLVDPMQTSSLRWCYIQRSTRRGDNQCAAKLRPYRQSAQLGSSRRSCENNCGSESEPSVPPRM